MRARRSRFSLDRRSFLRLGAGGVGLHLFGGLTRPQERGAADARDETPGALVLLQLTGGNDGLSLLVPYADDAYHRLRPMLARGAGLVLRLDERRGLHPALARLRARFDEGSLALVEGVGPPEANRSHFRSLDVWHTADPRGRRGRGGWIGRLAEQAFPADRPLAVVHLGASVPWSLASERRPPTAFLAPGAFRRLAPAPPAPPACEESAGDPAALAHVRRVARLAEEASAALAGALERHRSAATFPRSALGEELRTAAALVHAGIGVRVVSVELGGFDTHVDQARRHDRLMEELDACLDALLADLEASEAGRRSVVCAFSEFGRRVAENGSRGTDHGTAGPVLVAGAGVRGGFHGKSTDLASLEDGDPRPTTDFRSVYAGLIEGLFGVPSEPVLGAAVAPLALL